MYIYIYIGSIPLPVTVDDDGSVAGLVQVKALFTDGSTGKNGQAPVIVIYEYIYIHPVKYPVSG